MAGIVVAVVISERRLRARGFPNGTAVDLVVWAVPCGVVGARLHHVISDWKTYLGAGRGPGEGPLHLGRAGWASGAPSKAPSACTSRLGAGHLSFVVVADAVAPALPFAQAIGRWGNWWKQEIYGGPTSLPWAVDINKDPTNPGVTHYQPTLLYESRGDTRQTSASR